MPERISILHVIDHLGPGGAQAALRDFAGALRHDFDFHVAVLGQSGINAKALEAYGVQLFVLGANTNRWNPAAFLTLDRLVRAGDYKIVHAHLHKSSLLGGFAALWNGRKFIVHDQTGIYDPFVNPYIRNGLVRQVYLRAYRAILATCSYVLVLNPEMREQYLSRYGVPAEKVQIIPNPVNLQSFPTETISSESLKKSLKVANEKIVLMLGRLEYEKDWDTFLRVAELVSQEIPTVFLVVGSGSEEGRLKSLVDKGKIGNVFFLGYRTDIPELLQQTDVFLLTSRQDASPVVLVEAMAAQCPIVATRTVGAKNIIQHGINGLLADIGDAQGLAANVRRFLNDSAFARDCALRARATVAQSYGLETVAPRLRELYCHLVRS